VWLVVALGAAVFASPGAAQPPFTDLYFFGASWTDAGNNGPSNQAGLDWASYNYDPDRWTNLDGRLWSERFAEALGHPAAAIPWSIGGNNYAVSGNRADQVANQIAAFSTDVGGTADPGALYVIWAGANDMLQLQTPATTSNDLVGAVAQLVALGARHVFVGNMPDLSPLAPGSGPLGAYAPIPAGAAAWASELNQLLAAAASQAYYLHPELTVYLFDAASVVNPLLSDPVGNGFSAGLVLCSEDDDCIDGIGTENFLMQDHLHFTSSGHERIAQAAVASLPQPPAVPALQPAGRLAAVLLLAGIGLGHLRRAVRAGTAAPGA
jgi:phospholipase/lecithinase/hemolysin